MGIIKRGAGPPFHHQDEPHEEEVSDNETNYFDSLSPAIENQDYVEELKDDISNIKTNYSGPRTNCTEVLQEKTETSPRFVQGKALKNINKNVEGKREPKIISKLPTKGDVWFGSSKFWDKGERLAGERTIMMMMII